MDSITKITNYNYMEKINKYSEKSTCPKCGSGWISTKWDKEWNRLERKCDRCTYLWDERPLDDED